MTILLCLNTFFNLWVKKNENNKILTIPSTKFECNIITTVRKPEQIIRKLGLTFDFQTIKIKHKVVAKC